MSDRTETRVERRDGVLYLTMARPETRNALTGRAMIEEIVTTFDQAEADPSVSVVVVTGEGPAFSAGGDVKAMAERRDLFSGTPDEMAEAYRTSIQRLTARLLGTDVVTIAAVDGPAIGAGFDLVLGCDLRIGSTRARFAHTFVDLGIIPGDGGAWILQRTVGWQRAAELAFTARTIGAAEALEMGVLLEVVEPGELTSRVTGLATTIAAKPAHSIRLTKRLLRHARTMGIGEFLDLSAAYQAISHHTDAHHDAVSSYVQRLWKRTDEPEGTAG